MQNPFEWLRSILSEDDYVKFISILNTYAKELNINHAEMSLLVFLTYLKHANASPPLTFGQVAEKFGMGTLSLRRMLARLDSRGYLVLRRGDVWPKRFDHNNYEVFPLLRIFRAI